MEMVLCRLGSQRGLADLLLTLLCPLSLLSTLPHGRKGLVHAVYLFNRQEQGV